MINFKSILIAVTILHIIVLLNYIAEGQGSNKQAPQGINGEEISESKGEHGQYEEEFKTFIEKPNDREMSVTIAFEEKGEQDQKTEPDKANEEKSDKDCGGFFYFGVGVSHLAMIIDNVAKGYAAERAGIQVGDRVIGFTDHETGIFIQGIDFRGKEGSGLDIVVERNGKELTFTMVREKICYEI
jgi:hypothetical protein